MDATAHCADLLRTHDRDRYLCDLWAPEDKRPALFALHAFDVEIGRIRREVSEPQIGEIRLQWWRDVLQTAGEGHPVAIALVSAIADYRLPRAAILNYLEARVTDLYADPLPDLNALEGHAGETTSTILRLGALILAPSEQKDISLASGHGGVALSIADILATAVGGPGRVQAFLPEALLGKHRIERQALLEGATAADIDMVLLDLVAIARDHLAKAEAALGHVGRELRPAFLPLALVGPRLAAVEKALKHGNAARAELSPWRRQWLIWRAARRS